MVVGLAVWLVPIALVAAWRGPGDTLTQMGWFFSRASLVTFGGAYAVLAYVNVAAVSTYGWLLPGQMVVGLGLAETTPGPLIMVLEFVGFVGAYQHPGDLDPLVAGRAGRMCGGVGDVRAVLPVDLPGGALHRGVAGEPTARRGPRDHHGGGGRRDREPGGDVRPVDAVR